MNRHRPMCMYGSACYRRNPSHFEQFQHPPEVVTNRSGQSGDEPNKRVKVETQSTSPEEIFQNNPYGFFLTKIGNSRCSNNKQHTFVGITDILNEQIGQLIESAQFNYMFDIEWLVNQYPEKWKQCPLDIVFGRKRSDEYSDLKQESSPHSQIILSPEPILNPFGTHHSKMMFLLFEHGLRVVIHTANMIPGDWENKTQGVWISSILPLLNDNTDHCETNFKSDLLHYLYQYTSPNVKKWHNTIKKYDFSSVKVFLVSSVPGRHKACDRSMFGHLKLRKILSGKFGPPEHCWPVVCQFSSIGSLGANPATWLTSQFLSSLSSTPNISLEKPDLKCIFPSVENVRTSIEGYIGGGSVPYSSRVASRQSYLTDYFHRWSATTSDRTRMIPHIKSYCRISDDSKQLSWFCLTSANLSKAAWGQLEIKGSQLAILAFEIGVVFLPKLLINQDYFEINSQSDNSFPLPFDVPLVKYSADDKPWIFDICYMEKPDSQGNIWTPGL